MLLNIKDLPGMSQMELTTKLQKDYHPMFTEGPLTEDL